MKTPQRISDDFNAKAKKKRRKQNTDSKRSTETPLDRRCGFWGSDDVKQWYGCKSTANAPFLF